MRIDYISNLPMNADFSGDWIEREMKDMLTKKTYILASAQVSWIGAMGSPTGALTLIASNDGLTLTVLSVNTIDTSINTNDALLLPIDPIADQYTFSFRHNGMTSGTLSIVLCYTLK